MSETGDEGARGKCDHDWELAPHIEARKNLRAWACKRCDQIEIHVNAWKPPANPKDDAARTGSEQPARDPLKQRIGVDPRRAVKLPATHAYISEEQKHASAIHANSGPARTGQGEPWGCELYPNKLWGVTIEGYLIPFPYEHIARRVAQLPALEAKLREAEEREQAHVIAVQEDLDDKYATLDKVAGEMADDLEALKVLVEHDAPQSCGKCGTPDAACDMQCVEAAHYGEVLTSTRRHVAAYHAMQEGR